MTKNPPTSWPTDVLTLAIDIGGSGFKASVVNTQGVMTTERVRVDTPYPCTPERLVSTLDELVRPLLDGVHRVSVGFPPCNVWLGVTAENQARADERIPLLLQTPAAHRWVSIEPMLSYISATCTPAAAFLRSISPTSAATPSSSTM